MSKTNEQLAVIITRLTDLEKHFSNHLAHHWAVTIVLLGTCLTLAGSVVALILRGR